MVTVKKDIGQIVILGRRLHGRRTSTTVKAFGYVARDR